MMGLPAHSNGHLDSKATGYGEIVEQENIWRPAIQQADDRCSIIWPEHFRFSYSTTDAAMVVMLL